MPDTDRGAELLQTRLQYVGRKFTYRVDRLRLPHGVEGEYEYIRHPGAGLAVPIAPDGRFVLVKQFRFAIGQYLLEFPAGTLEPDEDPAATIARELEEETGYRAHRWQALGSFYICPGYSDEVIHAYLARELEPLPSPPATDEDEDIEVMLLHQEEIEQLLQSPAAAARLDAKSITAFHLTLPHL